MKASALATVIVAVLVLVGIGYWMSSGTGPAPSGGSDVRGTGEPSATSTAEIPTPGILPYTSGVRGIVMLGPTCPVERIPPDPACADKPFATTITVHRSGASATFAKGESDASGRFSISLPPGEYTLSAGSGSMLPRCAPTDASVGSTGYTSVSISCDTGIR